jgi:multidrug efflux pump subunit AcrB
MLSIPLSALVCLLVTNLIGGTVNTMLLGGLALAFSRLIDDSVVVLENIFRYMEMGSPPVEAAEKGGMEVSLAVLAATSTTAIVFFPVAFLTGISKYIFTPLALGVVISIFASYFFAMTVVPLFCAKFVRLSHNEEGHDEHGGNLSAFQRLIHRFNQYFQRFLDVYERLAYRVLQKPAITAIVILGGLAITFFGLFPFLGRAYFPRTDPGQFVVDLRLPSGTRIEVSNEYCARIEKIIRQVVKPKDLGMIVSNIGVYPDLSSLFTTNASMDTAFIQTSLKEDSSKGSYEYMDLVQKALSKQMPEVTAYYYAGGLIDSVINEGLIAPIDVQVTSMNLRGGFNLAQQLASKIKKMPNVSDAFVPQDLDYPGIALDVDRQKASLIGLSAQDVVDDVVTALTSDGMIAPSYWIDPVSGNNYFVTVQYANRWIDNMSMEDLGNIPLRGTQPPGYSPTNIGRMAVKMPSNFLRSDHSTGYTPLSSVANLVLMNTPTEVDHYQIQRVSDVYVSTKTEALNDVISRIQTLLKNTKHGRNTVLMVRGAPISMNTAFHDFGLGLVVAVLMVYLVLMSQFQSFIDPFIILMAVPPGLVGVLLFLMLTGSTLNVMSLMGVIMMTGIVVSNSILIVEFAGILHEQGKSLLDAVVSSCKIRLRPIMMTSLATLLGMIPLALGLEAGSQQYAPLARAIIGGLGMSVAVTVFLVPAVYLVVHGRRESNATGVEGVEHA